MKKKNIDRKEKLKKIGKIGLTIFNVLTVIWFFISFICIIIAACSGSLNTSGNNNGGGNRILRDVSSSLEGNVSEVARTKYETRENSGVYDDHSINNDYSITGIENYNSNYILTCFDDIDYSREYHVFMHLNYLENTLRTIALNYFPSQVAVGGFYNRPIYINSDDYFFYPTDNSLKVNGYMFQYHLNSNGQKYVYLYCMTTNVNTNVVSYFEFAHFNYYYDSNNVFNGTYYFTNDTGRINAFNILFKGTLTYNPLGDISSNVNDYKIAIFYFSEYSIHDIGLYFNYGSLVGNFSYLFPYNHYVNASNVFEYSGNDTSFLMSHEYQYIGGTFKLGSSSTIYNYLYIDFLKVSTYIYDLETRQLIYNATGTQNYIYVPYAVGLCNFNYYVNDLPSSEKVEVVKLCRPFIGGTGYFIGIDKYDNISSLIILTIDGNYIPSYPRGLTIYSTLFYDLKSQCAFVNGFYFYIDPNGNVHTGLTGAATGGDISNSYIGDVFKLINQILTSFTGFFGFYLLPGVSIGLLFALPLIFTIILFVVKLFKR